MKETRLLMDMPVTAEVLDAGVDREVFDAVFNYFEYIDEKFSTYKDMSEISMINSGELELAEVSYDMRTVFELAEQLRLETGGYFDIRHHGKVDPSGLVKGWAIANAAALVGDRGYQNYYVEAGGDFQLAGKNSQGENWRVGIRNPFNSHEIVKAVSMTDLGIATSGTYIRGQHIYNPLDGSRVSDEIVSLTVIGPDVYQADCYATAAFAMGRQGITFIEGLDGFEGYMIDKDRIATFTSGFGRYSSHDHA